MKALVLVEPDRFELQDSPIPDFAPDDVLVRVAACGICGSDVHGMNGSTGRRRPPIVMGHEAAGVIERAGSAVEGFQAGDRVTFDSTVYCGRCWFCRRGDVNLCDDRRVLGVSCADYRRHGAMADYVTVPERILVRLPDEVNFRQAAMVEPVSIALHAIRRTRITLGDTAVVVGAGMIGLLVVQALRESGCGRIFAVDLDPYRLDLACKMGAEEGLRSDQSDVPAEIMRRTQGRGADLAIEVVGIGPTLQTAIACVRKGGQVTLVGNLAAHAEFPLQAVVTRELTLNGVCASSGELPTCLEMIAHGKINVESLISATAPLDEGAAWFCRLGQGKERLMKVILEP